MLQYLSGHFKSLHLKRHETESFLFFLNYRVSFMLLMACCIAVTSNLYAGDPIVCTKTMEVTKEVMASYCWSHSTYSIKSAYAKKFGKEVPYPGVDVSEKKSDYLYRDYYQWIYLVLFIQGVFFYLPHGIWKRLESGTMTQITENVLHPPPLFSTTADEDEHRAAKMSKEDRLLSAASFLTKRWGWYNGYAYSYFFCEILALFNVILQALFLDKFFQGEFLALGKKSIDYFQAAHLYENPLLWVFPRVAKCHFHKFGPSGKVDTVEVLCVLPVNALSEKIYLFLWFWFLALFIFGIIGVGKSLMTIFLSRIRGFRLSFSLMAIGCFESIEIQVLANSVGKRCGFGDWFVLSSLAHKMDIFDFKLLLSYIKEDLMIKKQRRSFMKAKEGATAV